MAQHVADDLASRSFVFGGLYLAIAIPTGYYLWRYSRLNTRADKDVKLDGKGT